MDFDLDVEDFFNDSVVQSSSPPPKENKEKKKLATYNGEIDYMKGDRFHAMTNFSVVCTGYVTKDVDAKNAEGFLIDIIPKNSVGVSGEDANEIAPIGDSEKR